ncbi:MAG: hypothetical protein WCL04_10640 [Verrucomicrobiota bacterium]
MAHKKEPKVGRPHDREEKIFRLPQPPQPGEQQVLQRRELQVEEGGEHGQISYGLSVIGHGNEADGGM